jgi:adenylate cyclase
LALEPEEQLLAIAERRQDPVWLLAGHAILGSHLWWTGSPTAARAHLEQGMHYHDPQSQKSVWMSYGVDLGMFCVTDLALVLWCCGYPDQAVRKIQEALSLAPELTHSHSFVLARCWAAWVQQLCQQVEQILQEPTDAAITMATEQGLPFYVGILTVVHGWALAKQRNTEEGLAQIEQGLVLYEANVGEHVVPYFLALLAETQRDIGRTLDASQSLTKAFTVAEKNGEHFYDAELHRLKGELTLQQENQKSKGKSQKAKVTEPRPLPPDPQGEAEACFRKAIDISRKQQAKSLELRATVSLARLWQQQGKRSEAHDLLSEIYNWFTEGFGTKDLQEAKALLDSLESSV